MRFHSVYRGSCTTGRLYVRLAGDRFPYDGQMDPREHPAWSTPGRNLSDSVGNSSGQSPGSVYQYSLLVDFKVNNDGNWHNYYVALWPHYKGLISQIRLHPVIPDSKESLERTQYICLNAASGNTDRNEIIISTTRRSQLRRSVLHCGKQANVLPRYTIRGDVL